MVCDDIRIVDLRTSRTFPRMIFTSINFSPNIALIEDREWNDILFNGFYSNMKLTKYMFHLFYAISLGLTINAGKWRMRMISSFFHIKAYSQSLRKCITGKVFKYHNSYQRALAGCGRRQWKSTPFKSTNTINLAFTQKNLLVIALGFSESNRLYCIVMMNQLTQINILNLSSKVITKIFTMIDDKYLLRLREVRSYYSQKLQLCISRFAMMLRIRSTLQFLTSDSWLLTLNLLIEKTREVWFFTFKKCLL